MLLLELNQPQIPTFHMTTVRTAISILQSRYFKLIRGEAGDEVEDTTGLYHMSVARSTQSDFMKMMGGHGSVILVLNKARLQANNKITPYHSSDAEAELRGYGFAGDEMEDRIYSKSPTLPIRGPLNNTILQVRLLGGPREKSGSADFSQQDLIKLNQLCKQNNIPFGNWDVDDEQAFLHGR